MCYLLGYISTTRYHQSILTSNEFGTLLSCACHILCVFMTQISDIVWMPFCVAFNCTGRQVCYLSGWRFKNRRQSFSDFHARKKVAFFNKKRFVFNRNRCVYHFFLHSFEGCNANSDQADFDWKYEDVSHNMRSIFILKITIYGFWVLQCIKKTTGNSWCKRGVGTLDISKCLISTIEL